jgi:hypothetical protein
MWARTAVVESVHVMHLIHNMLYSANIMRANSNKNNTLDCTDVTTLTAFKFVLLYVCQVAICTLTEPLHNVYVTCYTCCPDLASKHMLQVHMQSDQHTAVQCITYRAASPNTNPSSAQEVVPVVDML